MRTRNQEKPGDKKISYVEHEGGKKAKKIKKRSKKGKWTIQQNQIYLGFLQNNKALFDTEFSRRSKRVFRLCAKLLKRRNSEQCRTHHQKYQARFNGDIDRIIVQVTKKIERKKKFLEEEMKREEQRNAQNDFLKQKSEFRTNDSDGQLIQISYIEVLNTFSIVLNSDFLELW